MCFSHMPVLGSIYTICRANIDAVATVKSFGIPAERAVKYVNDSAGTRLNYEAMSDAVCAMRCAMPLGDEWKKKIEDDFASRGKKR